MSFSKVTPTSVSWNEPSLDSLIWSKDQYLCYLLCEDESRLLTENSENLLLEISHYADWSEDTETGSWSKVTGNTTTWSKE